MRRQLSTSLLNLIPISSIILQTHQYHSAIPITLTHVSPFPRYPFFPKSLSSSSNSSPPTRILILDDPPGSSSTNFSNSQADTVYQTIVTTIKSGDSLETALDLLSVQLNTELVDDILHRLRYEEKLAFRFFTWAGNQTPYLHQTHTYNFMIDILSSTPYKCRQFGIVCHILDYMKRNITRNLVPIEALLSILREYADKHLTRSNKLPKRKTIKMKTPPQTQALNLLFDALCKCSLVTEAEQIFHRIKKKVTPNSDTFNILFFGWCRVQDPVRAMKLLEEMITLGHAPNNFTYNCAIDSFCSAGMVKEARELFEFMRTKGCTMSSPTAKTYSIMIVALAKCDMMEECFKLLTEMRSCGCLPDVSTYKEMIEGMCQAGKVDAAHKVLDEMSNTGFPPDILTYNCFLKVLCDLKKAEEAMDMCNRIILSGCEPSVHTYNMLITMFFEMTEPDRAVDIWHEMDVRGCKRVVDTYVLMIQGLFDSGRDKDARFLLDEMIDRELKLPYRKFDSIIGRLSAVGDLQAINRLSEHMRRFYNVAMARRFAITQKKMSMSLRTK
ncbi:Pentatricopeptide repeat-containing protein [Rhynchospora pubera]|uniref:Pentatricopeptide repeat-containing protein n=1 Tax=Rhynchospora pubera TaxID=906938 RepID=A0AAV8HZV8_9POAL|nr:Pentatricopeptide repeat-containing protein [Rhynchospora pubera]